MKRGTERAAEVAAGFGSVPGQGARSAKSGQDPMKRKAERTGRGAAGAPSPCLCVSVANFPCWLAAHGPVRHHGRADGSALARLPDARLGGRRSAARDPCVGLRSPAGPAGCRLRDVGTNAVQREDRRRPAGQPIRHGMIPDPRAAKRAEDGNCRARPPCNRGLEPGGSRRSPPQRTTRLAVWWAAECDFRAKTPCNGTRGGRLVAEGCRSGQPGWRVLRTTECDFRARTPCNGARGGRLVAEGCRSG